MGAPATVPKHDLDGRADLMSSECNRGDGWQTV